VQRNRSDEGGNGTRYCPDKLAYLLDKNDVKIAIFVVKLSTVEKLILPLKSDSSVNFDVLFLPVQSDAPAREISLCFDRG
jgi:hypothetical protein